MRKSRLSGTGGGEGYNAVICDRRGGGGGTLPGDDGGVSAETGAEWS